GDRLHGQPEGVSGDLGLGGVGARTHVTGRGLHQRRAVGIQTDPGLGLVALRLVYADRDTHADQPVALPPLPRPRAAAVPAELPGADGVAVTEPAGGE